MTLQTATPRRQSIDLFLVSFLILFLELACIRWFASTVVFLTFFTNIVLLATFLGMSVGCLAARNRRSLMETVMPTLLFSVALAWAVLYVYLSFGQVMIDVGGQGSPQQIYFGTEYRAQDVSRFVVPLEAVAATFFTLIALTFIGLGQTMGRAFGNVPDRVTAYTVNIAGSLAGIVAMAALSYLQTPPEAWFAIVVALCLYFIPRRTVWQLGCAIAMLLVITLSSHTGAATARWSPYYKIQYERDIRRISTNNIGHQQMVQVERDGGAGYSLPHLLNRDAGGAPFEEVLVVGAGSGTTWPPRFITARNTSTPSRSTRPSSTSASRIIPISRMPTLACPSTSTMAAASCDGPNALRPRDLRARGLAGPALRLLDRPSGELPFHTRSV